MARSNIDAVPLTLMVSVILFLLLIGINAYISYVNLKAVRLFAPGFEGLITLSTAIGWFAVVHYFSTTMLSTVMYMTENLTTVGLIIVNAASFVLWILIAVLYGLALKLEFFSISRVHIAMIVFLTLAALSTLGLSAVALLSKPRRTPTWKQGSMSEREAPMTLPETP